MSPSWATRRLSGSFLLRLWHPGDALLPFSPPAALTHLIHSLTQLPRVSPCATSHRKPPSSSSGRVRGFFLFCSDLHINIIITACVPFLHLKDRKMFGTTLCSAPSAVSGTSVFHRHYWVNIPLAGMNGGRGRGESELTFIDVLLWL